jgi:tetratricopeptide (TPR) repeat protein
MRILTSFGLLIGVASAYAQGTPLCLIGQPASVNGSAIIDLVNPLANELDSVGQLKAVTYAIEDPILRDAFLNGKVAKPERFYKLEDVQIAAKALNAPYVMWIEGQNVTLKTSNSNQRVLNCKLTLYKNGKRIWEDTDTQSVTYSKDTAADETIRSVMSSLNSKMQMEPLKSLPKNPKSAQSDTGVGKGQSPIIPETNDDDPVLNDWIAIQERVRVLLAENKSIAAEMLLRDAIDAAPADPVRRKALISFLQQGNQIDAAVATTIASAEALGDPSLTVTAGRILLMAGRLKEADEIIKDAMSTDPNNTEVQVIVAEIRMRTSMPDQALKHLENSIKTKPTAESFFLRAICRGLLGSEEGVKLDLERAVKEDPQVLGSRYWQMGSILDSAWEVEGPDLRSLLQKAELKRTSDEVAEGLDAQERMARACLALLGENPSNVKFSKSHGLRLLALNLLVQTLTELRHYVVNGDKESLSDARTDLGETIKTLTEAKEEFNKESTDAGSSNPPRQF